MSKNEEVGFASALRAGVEPEAPRSLLRSLIADKIHKVYCFAGKGDECSGATRDQLAAAEAVMELFAFVTSRDVCVRDDGTAWEPVAAVPTHREFEIRTVPTAVGAAGGGQPNASDLPEVRDAQ